MFDGAQTKTLPIRCLAKWYTKVVEVTVLPVPGGPWMRVSGVIKAFLTALIWK